MTPQLDREAIVRWVLANPDVTSADVATAFRSTPKLVGAHLMRATSYGEIVQRRVVGRTGRFAYGPPGWSPTRRPGALPVPDEASVVPATALARLQVVRAELERLHAEEAVLVATLEGYGRLGGGAS